MFCRCANEESASKLFLIWMVLGTRSVLLNLNILIFFRHNRQRSISRKLETRWQLCDFWTLTRCCCQCFHMFQLCPSAIWLLNYISLQLNYICNLFRWLDRQEESLWATSGITTVTICFSSNPTDILKTCVGSRSQSRSFFSGTEVGSSSTHKTCNNSYIKLC